MKTLKLEVQAIEDATPTASMELSLELSGVNPQFIQDIPIRNIVSYADNEKLFKAIIENDGDILTKYQKDNGYGHFYVKG